MRRILTSLLALASVATVAFVVTSAFFSDTETSTGNTLQAGELDLKIDNTCYYNGLVCKPVLGPADELLGYSTWSPKAGRSGDPNGERCSCTWEPKSLGEGDYFFNFADLKPGDREEDTISLLVQNDAWACMSITKTEDNDNTCTEPELLDDPLCTDPLPPGDADLLDGELGGLINFAFWADDGDNVYEQGEQIFKSGTASALFDGATWTLADSASSIWPTPGPLPGNSTRYIGKFWCLGTLTPAPEAPGAGDPTVASGFLCDGQALNNASQSDVLKADVQFTAVQSRHNSQFLCGPVPSITPSVTPTPTPTITITPSPTPLACQQADVMLVLDRSGSISASELASLKTAGTDFVDALGLTPAGIHAGMSSFATTGSLDHHLASNEATLDAAINALIASGFTNLSSGINLATGEFANPGDGHDRADLSSPDKMIVITDGHPNRPLPESTADDLAVTAADNARLAGVEVYVVGVGSDVNTAYLQDDIADDAAHYFPVTNYADLETALQNLDLCD